MRLSTLKLALIPALALLAAGTLSLAGCNHKDATWSPVGGWESPSMKNAPGCVIPTGNKFCYEWRVRKDNLCHSDDMPVDVSGCHTELSDTFYQRLRYWNSSGQVVPTSDVIEVPLRPLTTRAPDCPEGLFK